MNKMSNKRFGLWLIVIGSLFIALDFLAAPLGIANAEFGWKQILLLIVGIVLFVFGFIKRFSKK